MQKHLISLDIGNRQVKICNDIGCAVYPSYFVEASEYGNRDLLSLVKTNDDDINDYVSARDSDFRYVWGNDLDIIDKTIIDTISFSNRYSSLEFKLLVDFALARAVKDYPKSDKYYVEIFVGVPTDDLANEQAMSDLKATLSSSHLVTINDTDTYNIEVLNEVTAIPQPLGTTLDKVIDYDGSVLDDTLVNSYVGVVDVGGGTLIVNAIDNLNLTNMLTQEAAGAYHLYESIKNAIVERGYRISVYEVERFVREGNEKEIYVWSPNNIETIDFTDIVLRERKRYTRKVINIVKNTYKTVDRMKVMLVTGGTSNLLIKADFKKRYPIANFVEDAEIANARGIYKYAISQGLYE